jgi:cytoskeletal protein RodZ
MRNILVLIIIGAAGYYGWQAYQKNPQAFEGITKYLPKQQTEETASADSENSESGANANTATSTSTGVPAATPVPAPVFNSRIKTDGDKQKLPPGQFLVIERASVETKDGITAIVPGDLVRLVERRGNGTLQVTNGQQDFVVKESQVTQEVTVAQEAERREFQKRYGVK